MTFLTTLWLPIVVSAVLVFIAANILWMALPLWHQSDYGKLDDDRILMGGLSSVKSGLYMVPSMNWNKMTKEERAEMRKGPMALMMVRNPAAFNFGQALVLYFLQSLVIAALVAYVVANVLGGGQHVFRVGACAAFLAYGFRSVSDSIWYGKPWIVTMKEMIDGVIFALIMGATFAYFWPR